MRRAGSFLSLSMSLLKTHTIYEEEKKLHYTLTWHLSQNSIKTSIKTV